jgi:tRNA1Val (adenine37-N6)-methyltransferase
MPTTTSNGFLNHRLTVNQQSDGYRFSIDAVLLAASIQPKAGERLVDLGTGCAIIPLILVFRHPWIRFWAVELQDGLAELACTNVAANQMQDHITVVKADARQLKSERVGGAADWVISNPPFHAAGSGRLNPNDQKASARHELHLNLTDLLKAARRLLRTGGCFATIYPSERAVALLSHMHDMGIEPKWMRTVHSRPDEAARLTLVKGIMGGRPGLKVDKPLVVYQSDGEYTDEVQAMMDL